MSKLEIYFFFVYISLVLYETVAHSQDNKRYVCLLDDPSDQNKIQSRLNTLEEQQISVMKTLSGLQSKDAAWKKDFESMLGRLESVLTKMENQQVKSGLPRIRSPKFKQIGSKFYYIENNFQQKWISADKTCQIIGGQLAIIEDIHELAAINAELDFEKNYFVKIYEPIKFKFDSEKLLIGKCLTIFQGFINMFPCQDEHNFICKAVLD